MQKICDMPPQEIRIALLRRKVSQAALAREIGVNQTSIYRVIEGHVVSHKIREAIAKAAGLDLKQIWPSTYLYGGGPRKRGRPFDRKTLKNAVNQ
ncbi:MAG: helix-turn-helix domain-containing protein [Deltaproteobacteria bacterium]|nr:helix-turn-helix domain-containing protein [Deltaproteobacteria bacterium]